MTKNEIVARFMGGKQVYNGWELDFLPRPSLDWVHRELKFDSDRNWLHEAWVKFRDLKFDKISDCIKHLKMSEKIGSVILNKPITKAFDELCKGI